MSTASFTGNTKDCTPKKVRRYICNVCGNDWMSHLPYERDHGLCQVCDHFFYGDISGPIEPTSDQFHYLCVNGYSRLLFCLGINMEI